MRRFNLNAPELEDVGAAVGAHQIGARLYELEASQHSQPYHFHHGIEEWLFVVAGSPAVRTPEGEHTLRPGDLLCFPAGPSGGHEVSGPGTVLMISGKCAVDSVEYPDRGMVAVDPPGMLFRTADAVQGWERE